MDKIYKLAEQYKFLIVKVEDSEKIVTDKSEFEKFIQILISEVKKGNM